MTELTETFAVLKTWKSHFPSLKQTNAEVCILYRLCWCCRKCVYKHML